MTNSAEFTPAKKPAIQLIAAFFQTAVVQRASERSKKAGNPLRSPLIYTCLESKMASEALK